MMIINDTIMIRFEIKILIQEQVIIYQVDDFINFDDNKINSQI